MKAAPTSMTHAPLKSSNLTSAAYDPDSRTLEVKFSTGGTYRYGDVSPEKHAALMAAPSAGSYFHANIKPAHRAEKVGG